MTAERKPWSHYPDEDCTPTPPEELARLDREYWEKYGPDFVAEADNPRSIRVHGQLIWDCTGENWLSIDSGWHDVRFYDGRKIRTKALGAPKRIPEAFREALPDNAIFVHPITGEEVDWFWRVVGREEPKQDWSAWLGKQEERQAEIKKQPWVPKWKWKKQRGII